MAHDHMARGRAARDTWRRHARHAPSRRATARRTAHDHTAHGTRLHGTRHTARDVTDAPPRPRDPGASPEKRARPNDPAVAGADPRRTPTPPPPPPGAPRGADPTFSVRADGAKLSRWQGIAKAIADDLKVCPTLERKQWPCMRVFLLGEKAPCAPTCNACSRDGGKGDPAVRKRAREDLSTLIKKGQLEPELLDAVRKGDANRA